MKPDKPEKLPKGSEVKPAKRARGNDPDADGQDEGGIDGTKKAFSKPPKTKRK